MELVAPEVPITFAGLQIAPAPLYHNGTSFVIKDDDWNHDSYNSVYGAVEGSYYFNWDECHEVSGVSYGGFDDWRMPTNAECVAVITGSRTGSTVNGTPGCRYALIQLTGVTHAGNSTPVGLLLFPDGLTITGKTLSGINNNAEMSDVIYTSDVTGSELQAYLDQGCVFLPASGGYSGSSWAGAGTGGSYWSSTRSVSDFAFNMGFNTYYGVGAGNTSPVARLNSCRLVREAE